MTPLALKLSKVLTHKRTPMSDFWKANKPKLRNVLEDTHFFEVNEIIPMIKELGSLKHDNLSSALSTLGFLPAPKTWIEYKSHLCGHKIALYLEEIDNFTSEVHLIWPDGAQHLGRLVGNTCDCITDGGLYCFPDEIAELIRHYNTDAGKFAMEMIAYAHHILTIINSPHIIGRQQHMPHKGLESRLIKTFGIGKFPLHAWTEIKLHVAKPIEIDDGEPHEAHLTGKRALHFCRKHIRIRLGKLEYVSAHWRGDASIGIKQSRYKVCA